MIEPTLLSTDRENFIKSLRQETSESHQKLEANSLSKAILDPFVTLKDYQAYLSKLYGITIACEDQIFRHLGLILPDLNSRYKSQLLIEDLSATGLTDTEIDSLPIFHFDFSGTSEAMGVMYVLEGSTLGGRILYKHIHEVLGLTSASGASYFWGYGPETGILWKSFISSLSQYAAASGESARIIESAQNTFDNINSWLSRSN